jgi:predicted DNA-binding transcriptional regulator YafY
VVRADRLVWMVLLLQARGRTTALTLAAELGVSVRTVYRDLAALSASGVPVLAESGPGGGCELLEGYRFPLRGLRPEEAEALLILGVPSVLSELGLGGAVAAAHRQIRVTSGRGGGSASALVHLDMPRWFRAQEETPQLRTLAEALRHGRRLAIRYQRPQTLATPPLAPAPSPAPPPERLVGPLGLVNKAGTWYLVAAARGERPTVFRAARIGAARIRSEPFQRPAGFDLAAFWEAWSAEFTASRPRLAVRLRASPGALAAFGQVLGDDARPALDDALPADGQGWQEVTLSFEHELAAVHRLAGFGSRVEVLAPATVRERLVTTAQEILGRYRSRPPSAALGHEQDRADDHEP